MSTKMFFLGLFKVFLISCAAIAGFMGYADQALYFLVLVIVITLQEIRYDWQ